ncbi:MAG: bacteriohemerythrin [Treponema sp.]|nr:bacteriohemerythrin [Treponema sp.]
MNIRDSQSNVSNKISWNDNYVVGIKKIDDQHKELLSMTNDLFEACTTGVDVAEDSFKNTIRMMVSHSKEIFSHEEELFELTAYADVAAHKAQHRDFMINILEHQKKFQSGVRYVPNSLARFLMEWISSHVAVDDKKFGIYYAEKIDEMKITPQQTQKLLMGVKKFRQLAFSMLLTHLKEIYGKNSSEETVHKCVEVINAFLIKNRKVMAADYVIIKSL